MTWQQLKQRFKQAWVLKWKKDVAYLSVRHMLSQVYAREWDDYPWKVSEIIRFKEVSGLTEIYAVEKVLAKRYLLPNGDLKTEVEQTVNWQACLTPALLLYEIGLKERTIAFLPEATTILFDDKVFKAVQP